MTQPDDSLPAAPCIAAFCATCSHAHVGIVCNYQVITKETATYTEHGPCGCAEFVKITPTGCAFNCKCNSPKCGCLNHCKRHADAILAHRAKPKHKLHELAKSAHHPHD